MPLNRAHAPRHAARPTRRTARRSTAVAATVTGTAMVLALDVAGAATASAHDRSFPTMLGELRGCESGGNYSINTGNGYYGAYQFDRRTWQSVGGSGYPHQNPPAVQDEMATRLYESRGWAPWPSCSRKHGLHATTVERPNDGSAPVGHTDQASGAREGIDVRGWAFDQDNQPAPIEVHAYVDGRGARNVLADQQRDDVARAHGVGNRHGFAGFVPAAPGNRTLCLYAVGAGDGGNTSLGCRDVVVPGGERSPIGHLDEVRQTTDGVRVRGWTLDQDAVEQPTEAHVYVDGQGPSNVPADQSRPDVARAYGVPEARGFEVVVPAGSDVCAFAIDTTGQSAHTLLDCRAPA